MKKVNIHFEIFTSIAICAMLIDYFVYLFKMDYSFSLILSILIVVIGNVLLIKRNVIKYTSNWNRYDVLLISFVLIYCIMNIAVPDVTYDVRNYHIYLQENPFVDKLNFDFFAGKTINGFLFPLGDRMHYIFRFLLGYRLGTILSYYTLIVTFYSIKRMMKLLVNSDTLISVFAFLCTISSALVRMWTGTYYIDTFSIPLILEIITITFVCIQKNEPIEKKNMFLLALFTGIATAIKITNLILIVPILLFGFIKTKSILKNKVHHYLFAIFIALIPSLLYLIDNYIQTGSVLFPYYNNIFKSQYFGLFSWKDSRFGIPNVFYALVWPIYTSVIKLGYGDDWIVLEPVWAIGYVFLIAFLLFGIIKKQRGTVLFEFAILILIITFIWINFLEGYMRYALIIPILYAILISAFCIKFIKNKLQKIENKRYIRTAFRIVTSAYLLVITIFYSYSALIMNNNLLDNYNYLLQDKECPKIKIDGVWGTIGDDVYLTCLVRENDTPIVNLDKDSTCTNDVSLQMYNNRIEENDIFLMINDWDCERKLYYLELNGFTIKDIVKEYSIDDIPALPSGSYVYLVRVELE